MVQTFQRRDGRPVEWAVSTGAAPYLSAVQAMEARVRDIADGRAPEMVWLVEHRPLYTAGVSAKADDLLTPDRFPVFQTGRGGQFTYHGPGQRVAYVMLDLTARARDVRGFVCALEAWLIAALAPFDVAGETRENRIGVWVRRPRGAETPAAREDKIAAIGIKLRRWISYHGVSLNVAPDLGHFDGIVPCGVAEHGVTSLADLEVRAGMAEVDVALRRAFTDVFGPTTDALAPLFDLSTDRV